MPWPDRAEMLMRKAAADLAAVEEYVPNHRISDEILGFHAQQGVERSIKAVLESRGIRYRRTHDIVELIDTLSTGGVAFPAELDEVRALTPFAVALRYGHLPAEADQPVDRAWAVECARRTREWAEAILDEET